MQLKFIEAVPINPDGFSSNRSFCKSITRILRKYIRIGNRPCLALAITHLDLVYYQMT